MTREARAYYRQIRNGWGLLFMLGWIGFWWMKLSAANKAAHAALGACNGLVDGVKCSFGASIADTKFTGAMFLVVLVSPLAFLVSHYLARWRLGLSQANAERRDRRDAEAQRELQHRQSQARLAQNEAQAQSARESIGRTEFINKLGAVSDLLDLLPAQTDPDRVATTRLGISQTLRDLTAKHALEDLTAMVRRDEAVRTSLSVVLDRLSSAGLDQSAEARIVGQAYQRAELAPA